MNKEDILKTRKGLMKTLKKKKPKFRRQNFWRFGRMLESWRKPRGRHSKQRQYHAGKLGRPSIGYGAPPIIKHLHPTGYEEVMVANVNDLAGIDAKGQAARILGSVGKKKRISILAEADKRGIKVLNR